MILLQGISKNIIGNVLKVVCLGKSKHFSIGIDLNSQFV